jgi:purine-binding chemotaxis protein CheW
MATRHQYCTFYLDHQCYGLDVLRVQEIVRWQPLTHVPLAHPMVRGLMNLRGQIVTTIDLRVRLRLPPLADPDSSLNVVLQTDEGSVSLLVDEIGDVLDVAEQDFERPPETIQGVAKELIIGAYKLADRLLLILDPDRVISLPAVSL